MHGSDEELLHREDDLGEKSLTNFNLNDVLGNNIMKWYVSETHAHTISTTNESECVHLIST